jgi:hypothetical protein
MCLSVLSAPSKELTNTSLTAILKKVDPLFVVAAAPQQQTTGSAFSDIALAETLHIGGSVSEPGRCRRFM